MTRQAEKLFTCPTSDKISMLVMIKFHLNVSHLLTYFQSNYFSSFLPLTWQSVCLLTTKSVVCYSVFKLTRSTYMFSVCNVCLSVPLIVYKLEKDFYWAFLKRIVISTLTEFFSSRKYWSCMKTFPGQSYPHKLALGDWVWRNRLVSVWPSYWAIYRNCC